MAKSKKESDLMVLCGVCAIIILAGHFLVGIQRHLYNKMPTDLEYTARSGDVLQFGGLSSDKKLHRGEKLRLLGVWDTDSPVQPDRLWVETSKGERGYINTSDTTLVASVGKKHEINKSGMPLTSTWVAKKKLLSNSFEDNETGWRPAEFVVIENGVRKAQYSVHLFCKDALKRYPVVTYDSDDMAAEFSLSEESMKSSNKLFLKYIAPFVSAVVSIPISILNGFMKNHIRSGARRRMWLIKPLQAAVHERHAKRLLLNTLTAAVVE